MTMLIRPAGFSTTPLWTSLAVVLVLFTLDGGSIAGAQAAPGAQAPLPQVQKTELPPVVARVNGDDITRTELLAQGQMMRYQAVEAGQKDPGTIPGFSNLVVDALVSEHLMYLEMKRKGTLVSDEEVDREVASMAASYPDAATFEQHLAKQGISRESLRYQLKKNLSIEKLLKEEIGPGIKISEDALRAHYEKHLDKMKVPESRKVRHILMRIPTLGGEDARQGVESRLLALRQQVVDGAKFEELAKEFSEDTLTRERGGDLPWIAISGQANIFEETVAGLKNLGDVSGIIETEMGLHIVQLSDRKAPRVRTFEEVREEIFEFLKAVEMRNEIHRRLEVLRQGAKIEILI